MSRGFAGTPGGEGFEDPGAARKAANLSDLDSASAARTNLGLGGAAVLAVGTGAGDVAAGNAPAAAQSAAIAAAAALVDDLSGVSNASTARTNLGLGGAAVLPVGTGASTVAAGDDSRITGAAQKAANLSDLASASTARTNLGLGAAAVLAVGTGSGDVAAGDAPAAAQTAAIAAATALVDDLSGVSNASTARTNLGLGGAAVLSVGTTGGTVAAGAHAANHQVDGPDPLILYGGHTVATRIESIPRWAATANVTLTSGSMLLGYFTPGWDMTVANLVVCAGATASASLTLGRLGLYSVDGSGNLTLLQGTTTDTTILNTLNAVYTKSIASQAVTRGTRYAVGILMVGTTAGSVRGVSGTAGMTALTPTMTTALTGQTDLPSSVSVGSLVAASNPPWAALT